MSIAFPTLARGPSDMLFRPRALTQSHVSPFDGSMQTLEQPGMRWAATVTWPTLGESDRRTLEAFINARRGRSGRFWFGPSISHPRRATGTAGRCNWAPSPLWTGAGVGVLPTGWEVNLGTGVTLTVSATGSDAEGSYIELTWSGTPSGSTLIGTLRIPAASAIAAASGQVWTGAVTGQLQGSTTNTGTIRVQVSDVNSSPTYSTTTSGTNVIGSLGSITRFSVTRTLANVACGFGININATSTGSSCSGTLRLWKPQLERFATATAFTASSVLEGPYINGASQSGSTLVTDGWFPAVQAMRAGDFLGYTDTAGRRCLHQATADVTSDEAGNASIAIVPPIRRAGADNAVIEIAAPTGTFMLAEDEAGIRVRPPLLGSVTLEMIEALV